MLRYPQWTDSPGSAAPRAAFFIPLALARPACLPLLTLYRAEWYDVGQQHIMYNISFRNCSKAATGINYNGFLMHTFSDEFAPEFMQVRPILDDSN